MKEKLTIILIVLAFVMLNVGIAGAQQNYQYVDLGLPSGTLWATCNVGANNPWEAGDYFAWGETKPKTDYSWSSYKWCKGTENSLTKYCHETQYGYNNFVDNIFTLQTSDDVATSKMGNGWRMPTSDEYEELYTNCSWTWVTQNGKKGYEVRGTNGNKLFFPAAGAMDGTARLGDNLGGAYWLSVNKEPGSSTAYSLLFRAGYVNIDNRDRYAGFSVRAVRK